MKRILRALPALLCACCPAWAFDFDDVARRAKALADKPYEAPEARLPDSLRELGYDAYRDIRFRADKSLWRGTKLPFEVQFFHPGMYYTQPVKVSVIGAEGVRQVRFDPDAFDYGRNPVDRDSLRDLGFAGLRLHYPLNSEAYKDELIAFLGASYFRALGAGQRYGLSARGLAIDTGLLSGEEFPQFTEFWLEWPRAEDAELTMYALLDSRRVAGAYQFKLKPGVSTVVEVKTRLHLREAVGKLGIAPLTSMYFHGENQPSQREDYRPEVHDSDGLSLLTDEEWIWRPLVNPRRLLITSFAAINPRGFGLMQRDRKFDHYEDLEARYEQRPSAWIQPRGDWGAGRVELVQIPTPDETNDNIVAYWVPDKPPAPGHPLTLEYSIAWQMRSEARPAVARVVQSRRGHGYLKGEDPTQLFHVDFEGEALAKLPDDAKVLAGVWIGDNGELVERQAFRNDVTGGWRVVLRVRREDAEKPVEMRVLLRHGDEAISETWSYILPGEPE